ncbi:MAG: hypothetical protein JNN30_02745 [Rhodanobacteraceae bacterium]|nr:hypothetical protein [Rhodanobacteraceae bacterium]
MIIQARLPFAVAAICALLLAPTAMAQIYVNGTLSSGPTSDSGVAAPTGANWSELQHDTGNTAEANTSAGYSVASGQFRLADDFTVPATENWTLTAVNIFTYKTGSPATPSPFTASTLQIWNGRPGDAGAAVLCGDTTTNVLASSTDASLFRLFNSVAPPPGSATGTTRRIWRNQLTVPAACAGAGFFTAGSTYWISWDSTDSAAGAHFAPSKVVVGTRNPGGNARQLTVSSTTWTDVIDVGNPATAPDYPQDFPFTLEGTVSSNNDLIFRNNFDM